MVPCTEMYKYLFTLIYISICLHLHIIANAVSAGNKLLDLCPEWKSCGSLTMPKLVGEQTYIDFYWVNGTDCKWKTRSNLLQVIRCSWDKNNDFIYKLSDVVSTDCEASFCGMYNE